MKVTVDHTRTGVYCTSCGRLVGEEHTVSELAVCFFVAQRFPSAMQEIARERFVAATSIAGPPAYPIDDLPKTVREHAADAIGVVLAATKTEVVRAAMVQAEAGRSLVGEGR